jgi:hypothetical protein
MASIEARVTRRDGREVTVYDCRFRDPSGRQRRKTFPRKGNADRFKSQAEAAVRESRVQNELRRIGFSTLTMTREGGFDPRGYFVYCLWGTERDRPMYVGMSTNILGRLGSHVQNPDRRYGIERVTLLRCDSRKAALDTEARLIAEYQPTWNVAGVIGAPAPRPKTTKTPAPAHAP